MSNVLKIAPPPPPPRPGAVTPTPKADPPQPESTEPPVATVAKAAARPRAAATLKFTQVKEDDRVQFNKRVTRGVADGFEMLAIRTRIKVPVLLAEALELLEQRHSKVG